MYSEKRKVTTLAIQNIHKITQQMWEQEDEGKYNWSRLHWPELGISKVFCFINILTQHYLSTQYEYYFYCNFASYCTFGKTDLYSLQNESSKVVFSFSLHQNMLPQSYKTEISTNSFNS